MCIDFDKPRYIISLKKPKKHSKEIVSKGECGYPSVVGYFSLEDTFMSLEYAKDYIDTMVQFNMWMPYDGLTLDNIEIQEVNIKFNKIEGDN